MLSFNIIQAEYGDCFILQYGTHSDRKYVLIDGGPRDSYKNHLRSELKKINDSGSKLDLVILSHIDEDHVTGLLDMVSELREQKADHVPETIVIENLWHNSVHRTIDNDNTIENRMKALWADACFSGQTMNFMNMVVHGIKHGHKLRLDALAHNVPLNDGFVNDLICVDDVQNPIVFGNLKLHVVGPTRDNLKKLRKKWLEWLDKYEDSIATADPFITDMVDRSVPNLSSIMILAEMSGRKILLTGDGRGDHLVEGLTKANLLDAHGKLHVDILKIPHHGSDRNVSRKFFKTIIADRYVISANGKHGNPELATLIWIVEAAKEQNRSVEIIVTNETPSTRQLLEEYSQVEYDYQLTVMPQGTSIVSLPVVP